MLFLVVFLPILLAPAALICEKRSRRALNVFVIAASAVELCLSCGLIFFSGDSVSLGVCGYGLGFAAEGFGTYYTVLSSFCFFCALIFSVFYFRRHGEHLGRFYMFWLLTEGAVAGVFLSSDLFTLFLFFEIMGLASWAWVMHEENPAARSAADTYLAVSVIGGLVMLMGLFLVWVSAGTLELGALKAACAASEKTGMLTAATVCLLFGFGAKAGMFPLHIWLPKAHPAAPAPASAILSGILTKTGVFGIILTVCRIAPQPHEFGAAVLILGTVTMLVGAVLAVFSSDIKRTLACSSVSQIGFILIGVAVCAMTGGENSVAVGGTLLHMTNHSVFKLILFSVAGIIYANVHSLDLNKIRGFGSDKPLLKLFFCVGALGIGGFPLFSGYVSKTLLHEGLVELNAEIGGSALLTCVEWLFLFSGGLTVAYMLKLFFCVFTGKPAAKIPGKCMSLSTAAALCVPTAAVIALGCLPGRLGLNLAVLASDAITSEFVLHEVHFFSVECLKGAAISLCIGVGVYFGLVRTVIDKKSTDGRRVYRNRLPSWLDLEIAYRFIILKLLPGIFGFITELLSALPDKLKRLPDVLRFVVRIIADIPDAILVLLRRSIFRENHRHYIPEKGTRFTWLLGLAADRVCGGVKPGKRSYADVFGDAYENLLEENRIVVRSLSFSLLAACVGITLTLVYLFVRLIAG